MKITKLSDVDYNSGELVSFDATVINLLSEGDGEKKPFKCTLKLEESGEQLVVSSWCFDCLDDVKEAVETDFVYEITGRAGVFGNYGEQIRLGAIKRLPQHSNQKVIKNVDSTALQQEMSVIIDTYIPKASIYRSLIKKLIFDNPNFWTWPAASRIHHNYNGGLAKHSLNVCKNAIAIWKTYEGSNLEISTIVAGALLHDIGKLHEYKADGTRTKYGNLIPHPVDGVLQITQYAQQALNIQDPSANLELVMLEHIIISHHEKLEFGASTQPNTLEAIIVARADALDACFEASDAALDNLNLNEESSNLRAADGMKVMKWHN